jgi:hypothetical protein
MQPSTAQRDPEDRWSEAADERASRLQVSTIRSSSGDSCATGIVINFRGKAPEKNMTDIPQGMKIAPVLLN